MNETKIASPDLDIAALVALLCGSKWLIGAFAALGFVLAAGFALIQPEIFRAEALLQVRDQSPSLGRLGDLASLAGEFGLSGGGALSLGGGTQREVAIATLRSRAVIEAFITERNLLPKLDENKWYTKLRFWAHNDAADSTVWQAYNDFTENVLIISENRRTGLVTIAVEWSNPEEAQQWVAELVARTNAMMKERAIQEGERNLAYLQAQAQQIGQVALLQALYGLIEQQLKQMMVARGGDEFVLRTVDPAVVPKLRVRPRRTLISLAGFFIGGLLAAAVTLARASGGRKEGSAES